MAKGMRHDFNYLQTVQRFFVLLKKFNASSLVRFSFKTDNPWSKNPKEFELVGIFEIKIKSQDFY